MRKVYGVGVNDIGIVCPVYKRWVGILQRCYSEAYQIKHPHYKGCFVSNEWLIFSNFKKWVISQNDWDNLQIDKDLIHYRNKIYSSDKCLMVSRKVNMFITERTAARGSLMIGVTIGRPRSSFRASIGNTYLGQYHSEKEAHHAWWKAKCDLAEKLSSEQNNPRVAHALRMRYTGMSPFCTEMSANDIDRIAC